MRIHDWTKLDAGNFPHFHNGWLTRLGDALNGGLLPSNYYAAVEKHLGVVPDVVAVEWSDSDSNGRPPANGTPPSGFPDTTGGAAVAVAPPVANRVRQFDINGRTKEIAVRDAAGGRLRALVKIVSPANKSSRESVDQFVRKCRGALDSGVHVAVIDLFPPTGSCPDGLHALITGGQDSEDLGKPLFCGGYEAAMPSVPATAYLDPLAVGDELPATPLFLTHDTYIPLPLSETYERTGSALPAVFKRQVGVEP